MIVALANEGETGMKKIALGCLIVAGLVFGSAGAAVAGETRGNGDPNDNNGQPHSACHFSGIDVSDDIELAEDPEGFPDDGIGERGSQKNGYHGVQSYGAIVAAGGKAFVPSPGEACRGNVPHEE
jgi:hypothetical protein